MSASSSSDRIDAARKALAEYDAADALSEHPDIVASMVAALRALIEPPATLESPERIAERALATFTGGGSYSLILAGVHAGIQAAWQSWEPETTPAVISAPMAMTGGEIGKCPVCDRSTYLEEVSGMCTDCTDNLNKRH